MSQAGSLFVGGGGGGSANSFVTDDGIATPAAGIIEILAGNATNHTGSTVLFSGAGNTVLLTVTDADRNTMIGESSGNATMSGQLNVGFGAFSGGSLTSGVNNVLIGDGTGVTLTDGSRNVILGNGSGGNYTSNESDNIVIGHAVAALTGESHVLRIGETTSGGDGGLLQAFICGIDGVDVGSVATVVTEFGDQLGTAVITAGDGIAVTAGANTITISSTGLFFNYINVNTTPYVVLDTDVYLSVDSSGGPIIILLPDSAVLGEPFIIKDRNGTAATNSIFVTTVSGITTIDGVTSFEMDSAYQSISLVGNGSTYELY